MTREYTDRALRSFFGGRLEGQDRPQDVCTPPEILDPIRKLWPTIAFDPAGNAASIVEADRTAAPPADGKLFDWPDFTYCNPPFKTLKEWMPLPRERAEHILLVPVRTNRTWWCESAARSSRVVWLRPVKFLGHKQAFPAPLALLYYGTRWSQFELLFQHLGYAGIFT